jgi:tellurite resistance protein TehA-like permease
MLRLAMLRILGKILYWIAVLAVSVVLLVLLVRFFESRDESDLEGARAPVVTNAV